MAATHTHVLVLDFDGTVCLGDGPVFAYARLLDEALGGAPGDEGRPGVVLTTVEWFLGNGEAGASTLPGTTPAAVDTGTGTATGTGTEEARADAARAIVTGSVDGYEASERLARHLGATDVQLSAAYNGSRAELASGTIETAAPPGLAELLAGLSDTTQVVLVTNAPEHGVAQQLRHLGLAESFDEVVTSADKPAGMAPVVRRLLAQSGLTEHPHRLLSVGDIWRNDLAPAAGLGCTTALVERLPAPVDARPTFRASTIEQLYPDITRWSQTH